MKATELNVSNPVTVHGPWWGEEEVRFWSEGTDVVIQAKYDNDTAESEHRETRRLRFKEVSEFRKDLNPRPSIPNGVKFSGEIFDLGALVEFQNSEVAKAWDKHFNGLFAHKHFLILYLDENLAFEVISTLVELEFISGEDMQ